MPDLTPCINVTTSPFFIGEPQRSRHAARAVTAFVERTSPFCYDPLLPVATRPAPVTLPA
jgi:hypothetical protein